MNALTDVDLIIQEMLQHLPSKQFYVVHQYANDKLHITQQKEL